MLYLHFTNDVYAGLIEVIEDAGIIYIVFYDREGNAEGGFSSTRAEPMTIACSYEEHLPADLVGDTRLLREDEVWLDNMAIRRIAGIQLAKEAKIRGPWTFKSLGHGVYIVEGANGDSYVYG